MSDFKPFNPAPNPPGEFVSFRATIVNPPTPGQVNDARSASTEPTLHVHETPMPGKSQTPRITLRREGDRITHIGIECGCGQFIELECSY
ncbi:MAG: hypothetical protein JWM99_3784 [Verrucomicrobiales bacterium]|jgi:hypothetical protein|nr:hypothetical protein [Verrucomicrobiales bacterium]